RSPAAQTPSRRPRSSSLHDWIAAPLPSAASSLDDWVQGPIEQQVELNAEDAWSTADSVSGTWQPARPETQEGTEPGPVPEPARPPPGRLGPGPDRAAGRAERRARLVHRRLRPGHLAARPPRDTGGHGTGARPRTRPPLPARLPRGAARSARPGTGPGRRLPHLARPRLRRGGRLPLPVGFLPDRHLRAPPGERPAAGSAPLLAARVQTTAAPGGGDHPAHPRGDRRAPAVLAVADGDAGGGGLDHLRAERAAGADPGRLPRPGRRGGLAATALLVAERAGPG